ncbi:MAG: outer membrane protein assembly factor [Myxococcota bacterium]|nr:outer membrane protein assembly factor [Myxococcota bacterium]
MHSAWARIRMCVTAFALSFHSVNDVYAAEPDDPNASPVSTRRYEFAGFPIVGGNSDIGFQFGGATTLTRFYDQAQPYLWNLDLLVSASMKDDQSGFRLVQQSHVLRLDAPVLLHGRMRVDARASFLRTINAGYYGLGNASTAEAANVDRRYQYVQQEGWLRGIVRVHTGTAADVAVAGNLRYEAPAAYAASKLAEDLAQQGGTGAVIGGQAALLGSLTAGVMIDTRDNEFVTTRGIYYQLGFAGTAGSSEDVAYGEMAAVLAHYAPLGGPFIFASRIFCSFRFGRMPFYDLQQGGAFEPESLLGGDQGVRGVPQGRYAGLIKAVTNVEIRSTPFPRFHLLGQRFRIGTTTFVDAGRVWNDYHVISGADGASLGLKYGVGGGLFAQWGEAAIFRVEVAYSPDAVSENPGFPLGIYVADGLMF